MQSTELLEVPADSPRILFRQPDVVRTPVEHLMEFLLTGTLTPNAPGGMEKLAKSVLSYDTRNTRIAILGGGTGLSTVVGGNSQRPDWAEQPCVGIKKAFPRLHSIICTTDDGGSTGKLLKLLPMIGVGDIRKILISSILPKNLQQIYKIDESEAHKLLYLIHALMTFRFPDQASGSEILKNPLLASPQELRSSCPQSLARSLRKLGAYIPSGGSGHGLPVAGHSLGNFLLTSAIFMETKGPAVRAPRLREIQAGIDHIASLIGAPAGQIHAATSAPGQLKIRYANGVEVYGESKSARTPRNSPVERICVEYARKPLVSAAVVKALEKADLIIFAPGSLYTSIIPVLQLEPIASAIRANKSALKILGANTWIQEGETDISLKNQGRGFLVSELIEAYDRNVPGGVDQLFNVVLCANLEHIPINILRNYAFEGKSPIHLDRARVEAMGIQPLEATLLSTEDEKKTRVIHHDAGRFTLAVRTLLYADRFLRRNQEYVLRRQGKGKKVRTGARNAPALPTPHRSPLLCDYLKAVRDALVSKDFRPESLRDFLIELTWENRDITPAHFRLFRGGLIIPAQEWDRSTEWDNVLGYYDPMDQYLKFHEMLLTKPARLREDMLVAVGESLLGQYIESRRWIEQQGARCYEIVLKPAAERECYLSDSQLHAFLKLARMIPDAINDRIYRITINNNEGFLPPGLLFGLTYAWYLSGNGITMDYEMTLLRWPLKSLIPLHAKDSIRKNALVKFFRNDIFGHGPD
jgi:uncharacterized cofD-like protein